MDIEYHTSVKQELCMYVCVCVCNRRKKRELFFIFLRILRNKERSDRFFAKLTFFTDGQTNCYQKMLASRLKTSLCQGRCPHPLNLFAVDFPAAQQINIQSVTGAI